MASSSFPIFPLLGIATGLGLLIWGFQRPKTSGESQITEDDGIPVGPEATPAPTQAMAMVPLAAPAQAAPSPPSAPAPAPGSSGQLYKVIAPDGLTLRKGPGTNFAGSVGPRMGTTVSVVSTTPNGWAQLKTGGYVCMSCLEAPGGPWLVPA